MKTHEKIIELLKMEGPLSASVLSNKLGLTTMGIRQHVQGLEDSGEVTYTDEKVARGRPTRYWTLTKKGHCRFADKHADLSVTLLDSIITVFGDNGLAKLITEQESIRMANYRLALADRYGIEEKLITLAKLRSDEGYMAVMEQGEDGVFWLIENHCPICVAATKHKDLCLSELTLFQTLLSDVADVTREDYIIAGDRRCAYKIIET